MVNTPLQDALNASPGTARTVRSGEYRGAGTAASLGDPQAEFEALRVGCGVYDLGYRSRIVLAGEDRIRWLNGMVTNNIRDLAPGRGVYAFLLNPQGHILGDLYAYNQGDSVLVDTDRSQAEKIAATFDHYIIMDDVEVNNLGEQITAIGVAGPKAREVLQAAGVEIPQLEPLQVFKQQCECECGCLECIVIRKEDMESPVYEIWLEPRYVKALWDAVVAAGATRVGSEALEMLRIVDGVPLYGVDIRERDLPQETEQARALNFNKGCYVGQEIVERIRSRGSVHRKFAGFVIEGSAQVAPATLVGMKIASGEKEVGEITSATRVRVAGGERTVALGYIRREIGVPGREVTIGTARATVAQLPVTHSFVRQEPVAAQP